MSGESFEMEMILLDIEMDVINVEGNIMVQRNEFLFFTEARQFIKSLSICKPVTDISIRFNYNSIIDKVDEVNEHLKNYIINSVDTCTLSSLTKQIKVFSQILKNRNIKILEFKINSLNVKQENELSTALNELLGNVKEIKYLLILNIFDHNRISEALNKVKIIKVVELFSLNKIINKLFWNINNLQQVLISLRSVYYSTENEKNCFLILRTLNKINLKKFQLTDIEVSNKFTIKIISVIINQNTKKLPCTLQDNRMRMNHRNVKYENLDNLLVLNKLCQAFCFKCSCTVRYYKCNKMETKNLLDSVLRKKIVSKILAKFCLAPVFERDDDYFFQSLTSQLK